MTRKPYPNYKPSGIQWLGKVPEHWVMKKIKYVTNQVIDGTHVTPTYVGNGIPFLRVTDIQMKNIDLNNVKFIPELEHNMLKRRCSPKRNDVLLSKNGTIGITKVVDWDWDFSIFVSLCLIKLKIEKIYPFFFCYQFGSSAVTQQITEGTKQTSVINLHLDKIKELLVIVPSLPEQQIIAAFLDRETGRIDALTGKQEKLVDLLKEKRSALISRAITRGLDDSVKLKPSGVQWLGEVPEHWEVMTLKNVVSTPVTDGPHETPKILDEGIPFISAEAIRDNKIDFSRKRGYISEAEHRRFSLKYHPKRDDIYMIKSGATTGKLAIVETDDEFNIWSPLAVIRVNIKKANAIFILLSMNSKEFQTSVQLFWSYGTQQNIGMNVIENLRIPLPPLSEQLAIAAFLDRETAKIDTLIAKAKTFTEKLKEYRTALISAAVTGKIDLREAL
jgi:type I restriction enzyme, S subunit